MILFEEDFYKQNAIVHFTTKNKSFIRMHLLLKRMGVKNNKFFLALYNPKLMNIDPYSDNLTMEEKLMIAHECKINPWYFLREVCRIPQSGGDPVPFELSRANLALWWCFFNNIDIFLTMPRQLGKTIGTISLYVYLMYVVAKNSTLGLFARNNKLILSNVQRLKDIRDALPKYLVKKSIKDIENKEGVKYHEHNVEYRTYVATGDKNRAAEMARGDTIISEHWDEFAWFTNNMLAYPAAISATDKGMVLARKAGMSVANVITTTAGRLDDKRGAYAYSVKSECMVFSEILYDSKNINDLLEILQKNSMNDMIYMEFSYQQLGMDENWYKIAIRGKTQDEIAMDVLNQWLQGSNTSVLTTEQINKINESLKEPVKHTFYRSLILKWYVDPESVKHKTLILGIDTSDNIGKDFTTLVLLDPNDLSVVMTCRCNESNLMFVAKLVVKLLLDYHGIILIPERNKNGAMLIDIILELTENIPDFNPFKRIYNTFIQNDIDDDKITTSELKKANAYGLMRKGFGFTTTKSETSRDMLYKSTLMNALDIGSSRIHDQVIISELKSLTTRNGRIDHPEGGHDDTVIAYLLACYFVLFGKHLELYALDKRDILSHVNTHGDEIDPVEKERQLEYRYRIKKLEQLIEQVNNPVLLKKYKNELYRLQALIDDTVYDEETLSYSQIEDKKEEEKKATVYNTIDLTKAINLYY